MATYLKNTKPFTKNKSRFAYYPYCCKFVFLNENCCISSFKAKKMMQSLGYAEIDSYSRCIPSPKSLPVGRRCYVIKG